MGYTVVSLVCGFDSFVTWFQLVTRRVGDSAAADDLRVKRRRTKKLKRLQTTVNTLLSRPCVCFSLSFKCSRYNGFDRYSLGRLYGLCGSDDVKRNSENSTVARYVRTSGLADLGNNSRYASTVRRIEMKLTFDAFIYFTVSYPYRTMAACDLFYCRRHFRELVAQVRTEFGGRYQ